MPRQKLPRAVLDLDNLRFDQGEGRRNLELSLRELA
jgi:hypothetical protein